MDRRMRVLVTFVTTALLIVTAAVPAQAAPAPCQSPADPGQVIEAIPWQQRWLAPERVWPFSTGAGVRVAVVDSGTDASHPQLEGQIEQGFDMLSGGPGGNIDCISHGTAVASIIAARRQQGVGFVGLAPGAKIMPVRVSEREIEQGQGKGSSVSPEVFAAAIRRAVDDGATVVNMSVTLYGPNPDVKAAIEYARAKDVVLVAAAGNQHQTDGRADPLPYPAAYEGVIGVGAIDEQGARVDDSQVGPYVDIVAPGGRVVAATRVSGHEVWSGTSFATPMVSATAALMRSAEPGLNADEVARRLLATVDPARGDAAQGYGRGVLNPYRAVTERLTDAAPRVEQPLPDLPYDAAAAARAQRWETVGLVAVVTAVIVAVLLAAAVAASLLMPHGRRRRWRPTRPPRRATSKPEVDEPEELFFRVPGQN
ncbi:MAG: type VII secretion-associated serine protease mycosin [Actinoplanes sp.]